MSNAKRRSQLIQYDEHRSFESNFDTCVDACFDPVAPFEALCAKCQAALHEVALEVVGPGDHGVH